MNSFMLYRSAYSERTKIWCLQNNHQVVSSVSGESWPLEPPHIREKYSDLAKRERENHQRAHPGYKFSPSKTLGGKKRKAASPAPAPTDEDQEVELDDIDYLGLHSKRRALNSPAATLMLMGFETGGAQRSSFIHNNPGKTPPQCMAAQDLSGQYYQTTVHAHAAAPIPNPMPNAIIEDVTIRKTQAPVCSSALFQSRNESCFLDSAVKVEELEDNSKVDPALLGMGEEEGGHGQVLFDVFGGGEEFGWGMGMYLENREPWTVEEVDYDEWLSKAGGGC